jgi:IS30 family transposase
MKRYKRLGLAEREEISRGLAAYQSFSEIAIRINRPTSTVTREVWNNCKYSFCYRAERSHEGAVRQLHRQKQPKLLDANLELKRYVLAKLRKNWSPEEIAHTLKLEYPECMTMRISHESIYTYLYCLPKGSLRKEMLSHLRHPRRLRNPRKLGHQKRGQIVDAISISERPKEVEGRIIPGHWEGDLLMGSKRSNTALGTLVERTTRYTILVPLKEKDAFAVRTAFAKAVKRIPAHLKKTMTYDRGLEMAQHKLFTKESEVQVYFADPRSPWQRGTNENTNGLLRQYFPKGTDFREFTTKQIKMVQDEVNDRPRKALGFQKPDKIFSELLINLDFALEG